MKRTACWAKCFPAYSEIEMLNPSEVDGDYVFEVTRSYDGVFDEEYFDVEATMEGNVPRFEVHEGGYDLTEEEIRTMTQMVWMYQNQSS